MENLSLKQHHMQIFIKTITGQIMVMDFQQTDLIQNVKAKIKVMQGIPTERQKLIFAGFQIKNHKSLADYGIKKQNTIHLIIKLNGAYQISVKTSEKQTLSLDVDSTDSIQLIKAKIYRNKDIPVQQQILIFAEKELQDSKSLHDYNIRKYDTIQLVLRLKEG